MQHLGDGAFIAQASSLSVVMASRVCLCLRLVWHVLFVILKWLLLEAVQD